MKAKTLVVNPEGGLANRMRVVAASYNLCKQSHWRVEVVWFKDKGLNAEFDEIFDREAFDRACSTLNFHLREAGAIDHVVNDRPRLSNLHIPAMVRTLIYDKSWNAHDVMRLVANHQDAMELLNVPKAKRIFLTCYRDFGNVEPTLYPRLFAPCAEVKRRVQERKSMFSPHTIGLHIRRTDNVVSIANSPTELFEEAVKKELAVHPDLKVFLATDSQQVKQQMTDAFGERVITPPQPSSRSTRQGIIDALTDMWTLAATSHIYGSVGSTFSEMASFLGQNELSYIQAASKQP